MERDMQLFKVNTRGCGLFYVVAETFDGAAEAVNRELNSQDYGYTNDRLVMSVDFVCRQTFMSNGKRALYGEKDENHLIIAGVNKE